MQKEREKKEEEERKAAERKLRADKNFVNRKGAGNLDHISAEQKQRHDLAVAAEVEKAVDLGRT